jgi:hypothetical protein
MAFQGGAVAGTPKTRPTQTTNQADFKVKYPSRITNTAEIDSTTLSVTTTLLTKSKTRRSNQKHKTQTLPEFVKFCYLTWIDGGIPTLNHNRKQPPWPLRTSQTLPKSIQVITLASA